MLAAALRAGKETLILASLPLRRAIASPLARIPGNPCPDILIGRQIRTDPFEMTFIDLAWPVRNGNLANRYAELAAFHENAGRRVALAHVPGKVNPASILPPIGMAPEGTSLGEALSGFTDTDPIVKQVWPAKSLPLLTLSPRKGMTHDEMAGQFARAVEYHICNHEGDRNALLVQERISMECETRFFVIDGEVVCGAACIESHTPQQNRGSDLDALFETRRNSGDIIECQATAGLLMQGARRIAAQIAAECPDLVAYTLDLTLGTGRQVLVIEMNPAGNAGLYAQDVDRLLAGILTHAGRVAKLNISRTGDPASDADQNPGTWQAEADEKFED